MAFNFGQSFRRGTSALGGYFNAASSRARARKSLDFSRMGSKKPFGSQFAPQIGNFRIPVPNLVGGSSAVVTSEPARAQFGQDVDRLGILESAFAPPTDVAGAPVPVTPPAVKEGEVPATPQAITFKSPNVAFQALIDQTNSLIEQARSAGGLTPENQNSINQLNLFEAEKTKAIAQARDAADKGDASALNEAMGKIEESETQEKDIVTQLIEEMREARASFIEAGAPSARETELRRNLQELQSGRELLPLELRQQGISASGIQAGQIEDERVRAIQEGNLLFELGLEQEGRQFRELAAEKQLGFIRDDLDLQFKIEERIADRESKILEEARNLRKDSLSALSDIVTQFTGLAFQDLDPETQAEVLDMAKQFNIPPALLSGAMQNAKEQQVYDRMIEQVKLSEKLGAGAGAETLFKGIDIGGGGLLFTPNRKLSAKEKDKIAVVNQGANLVNEAERLYNEMVGGEYEGFGSTIAARIKGLGRFFGKSARDPVKLYIDYLDSNRAPIAKGIKGEVGNLTELEQKTALKSFPTRFDSPKGARQKFEQIRRELQGNLETFGEFSPSVELEEVDQYLDFILEGRVPKISFKSVEDIIKNAPKGITEEQILSGLKKGGYEVEGLSVGQRFRKSFGDEGDIAEIKRAETLAGTRGKAEFGDIADVAGKALTFAGFAAGAPLGVIGGAAGAAAGETARQAIGKAIGEREKFDVGEIAFEGIAAGVAGGATKVGGKLVETALRAGKRVDGKTAAKLAKPVSDFFFDEPGTKAIVARYKDPKLTQKIINRQITMGHLVNEISRSVRHVANRARGLFAQAEENIVDAPIKRGLVKGVQESAKKFMKEAALDPIQKTVANRAIQILEGVKKPTTKNVLKAKRLVRKLWKGRDAYKEVDALTTSVANQLDILIGGVDKTFQQASKAFSREKTFLRKLGVNITGKNPRVSVEQTANKLYQLAKDLDDPFKKEASEKLLRQLGARTGANFISFLRAIKTAQVTKNPTLKHGVVNAMLDILLRLTSGTAHVAGKASRLRFPETPVALRAGLKRGVGIGAFGAIREIK